MTTETLSLIVGAGGLVFGIFSWFTSGVLKDKAKIIEHEVKISNLERRTTNLEKINESK